jgi:hypothetical protein
MFLPDPEFVSLDTIIYFGGHEIYICFQISQVVLLKVNWLFPKQLSLVVLGKFIWTYNPNKVE